MPGVVTDTTDTRLIDYLDKIQLSNGAVLWMGDNWAREKINTLENPLLFLGKCTAPDLSANPTSQTVTVGGQSITAEVGNIVLQDRTLHGVAQTFEYIWSGTNWEEFGSRGDLKALAYKDTATGTTNVSFTDKYVSGVELDVTSASSTTYRVSAGDSITRALYEVGLKDSEGRAANSDYLLGMSSVSDLITYTSTTVGFSTLGTATINSANILIAPDSTWSTYTSDGKLEVNIGGGSATFTGNNATLAASTTYYGYARVGVSNSNGAVSSERARWTTYVPTGTINTSNIDVTLQTAQFKTVSDIPNVVNAVTVSTATTDSHMLVLGTTTTPAVQTTWTTAVTDATAAMGALNFAGTTSYFRSYVVMSTNHTMESDSFAFNGATTTTYTPTGTIGGISGAATAYLKMPAQNGEVTANGQISYDKATVGSDLDYYQLTNSSASYYVTLPTIVTSAAVSTLTYTTDTQTATISLTVS